MSKSPAQSRDRRARIIIIIQAAVLALVFHLVLALGFYYKTPPQAVSKVKPLFNYMVSLDSSQKSVSQFNNWLKYQDPSVFIKPNSKYGFSATPHQSKFDSGAKDGKTIDFPDKLSRPEYKLANSRLSPVASTSFAGYIPTPPRPEKIFPVPSAPSKYPVVLDERRKIMLIPEFKNLKLQDVSGPTALKLIVGGDKFFPRVVLKKSCGRKDLDLQAVDQVLRACVTGKMKTGEEQDLYMFWVAPKQGADK